MVHVFIINPIACPKGFATKIREYLKTRTDITSYVLSSKGPGDERELVSLMCHYFDNEVIRFYSCGGNRTLRNVLDGVAELNKVEIAIIPYGDAHFVNNFTDSPDKFRDVAAMISGNVMHIDYIETNLGRALNCVSVGADADIASDYNKMYGLSILGSAIPYGLATFNSAIVASDRNYTIKIDEEKTMDDSLAEVSFSNGAYLTKKYCIGIDKNINDGLASYSICKGKGIIQRIRLLNAGAPQKKKVREKLMKKGHCKKISVRRENGTMFNVSLDGNLMLTHEIKCSIVQQGVALVLPKEVYNNAN